MIMGQSYGPMSIVNAIYVPIYSTYVTQRKIMKLNLTCGG